MFHSVASTPQTTVHMRLSWNNDIFRICLKRPYKNWTIILKFKLYFIELRVSSNIDYSILPALDIDSFVIHPSEVKTPARNHIIYS